MLTEDRKYVLHLLKKSLGIPSEEDTGVIVSAKAVEDAILRGGLILTVFQHLTQEMKRDLNDTYLRTLKQAALQEYEGKRVMGALGNAGFRCMALKGWELKKLYPDKMMRQMADLDILVKPYDYKPIKKIMLDLGYSSGGESSWMHDDFTLNEVTVEMHKRLTDDSGVIRDWESDMWNRAKDTGNNVMSMSFEDSYIFHFIHLYKDFLNGSLGLRRIADTWLLQQKSFDRQFTDSELKKMGIDVFCRKMSDLSRACMGEIPMERDFEILLTHAFNYGINGSVKSYKVGRIASMSDKSMAQGKLRSGLSAVFLPYARMKAQFPVLRRWPVLLPFCWIKRICSLARNSSDNRYKLDYKNINKDDYDEMKEFFRAGGVN